MWGDGLTSNPKTLETTTSSKMFIYCGVFNPTLMMSVSASSCGCPSDGLTASLLDELNDAVFCVKRSRKWYLVKPTTKAFIKALKECIEVGLDRVRSPALIKAIVKTIIELKRIVSVERRLVEAGIGEAWKLSELAQRWGHKTAREWRNNKAYIIVQALTLQWVSKLFRNI
jgi:hypothetical protein